MRHFGCRVEEQHLAFPLLYSTTTKAMNLQKITYTVTFSYSSIDFRYYWIMTCYLPIIIRSEFWKYQTAFSNSSVAKGPISTTTLLPRI